LKLANTKVKNETGDVDVQGLQKSTVRIPNEHIIA
jgi:hypothetical protein